ncbi:hypothetical protein J2I47_10095 [Fibrella sp. HMF5335]|uniref:Uncharacterized protein n=1 Tax=Fibrella rubiginis TaxID=2817060 RepID=A0A939K314_9BACT|nr:hypothetical protein [Fibrella rubiginis]MBO0936894.1 hypothetical protein [Fibrella rubiginis]
MNVYADLIDLIAPGVTPEQIINFKPSTEAQDRLSELLYKNRTTRLTAEEERELDRFRDVEHIIRMAKARARKYVEKR